MKRISSRFITGVVIVIVGLALLLSSLEILQFGELIRTWWPLIVVAAGIVIFVQNTASYLWAILIVAIGIVLQLNHLGVTDVEVWRVAWPIVIILVGVSILVNRKAAGKKLTASERQDITAILSGSEQRNNSQDFKGSRITAVMGGAQIDLRKATIKKEATLDIFAFWGGVEVIVPEGVVVKNQLSNILGGSEDHTVAPTQSSAPVLHIIGDVVMAGVEIKN